MQKLLRLVVISVCLSFSTAASAWTCMEDPENFKLDHCRAPRAFRRAVRRRPELSMRRHKAAQVEMGRLDEARAVNRRVNRSMIYTPEAVDDWLSGSDCDDYARQKLLDLLDRDFPRGALRLAMGRTPEGVYHLVLLVDAADGQTLVLDNRNDHALPIEHSNVTFLLWQSPGTDLWQRAEAKPLDFGGVWAASTGTR
ncbi:transglutaminase-like cysteine peptidase [Pelagibius sp.]|uniref:transglutaminase-like cysteine peptidase n=1 Tax=Pelagibius sp. TaxID=1931238 RepID=UPI002637E848|nr:transglutaminase-like cysteine peptidase [Pelagibius sp.]